VRSAFSSPLSVGPVEVIAHLVRADGSEQDSDAVVV